MDKDIKNVDLKKFSEVYGLMYIAHRRISNECYDAAKDSITEAMNVIKEHLSALGQSVDEDAAFGPLIDR